MSVCLQTANLCLSTEISWGICDGIYGSKNDGFLEELRLNLEKVFNDVAEISFCLTLQYLNEHALNVLREENAEAEKKCD